MAIYWFNKQTEISWSELVLPRISDLHYLHKTVREAAGKAFTALKRASHPSRYS
jgi:hypothetical protein